MASLRDYHFQISYGPADDRLHDFYIPALSASVRCDRCSGFFCSSALTVAAAGVARLIANGGTMRLLVGAALTQEDVQAIARGQALEEAVSQRLVAALTEPAEDVMRRRLEVLAWMVADDTLEIRVVLPTDRDGRPLPRSQAQEYYHPKEGIFTDANGDRIAFSGSINETTAGWQRNYEQFSVYFSWDATAPYLAQVVHRFESLWRGEEPSWIALDIPEAARQRLLTFQPATPPTRDPLESTPEPPVFVEAGADFATATDRQREQLLFQFLRDAPYLPNAAQLGAATSAVVPWPHQARIADTIVQRFPERFLLCDEVGLGKTIEAGLAIRQLVLSGRVRRCLILTPKSVARQWQEELYEKFVLNVPLYDGHGFRDVFGNRTEADPNNPWDTCDLFIASSQLAKRRQRQPELLTASPWDLVVVDEAHHARRKDFLADAYRPNRLLQLLNQLKGRTQGLLLMTATPMQVHPVEVWDLLSLLGVGGRWGASWHNFLRFFRQLRAPSEDGDTDWDFVFGMMRDFLDAGGEIDPLFAEQAQRQLGLVDWSQLQEMPHGKGRAAKMQRLSSQARAMAIEMARRHTPLSRYVFRSTRSLLREYARRGVLKATVPRRRPEMAWIPMTAEEEKLYRRIEEYISGFYQKYEAERKGLGFVMTVYRRRLTSSFYAVRRSLERRLAFLRGEGDPQTLAGFDEDDLEQEDLTLDISEELEEEKRDRFQDEIEYVEDFLAELRGIGENDTKVGRLLADLDTIFKQRDTVIVFTQYADTMDFLRDQLRQAYGSQVACYSGRGGEFWNGIAWTSTTKEQIKNDFLQGEAVKILVCTEAASEGLNLQTCGVLINYDMPWNPMRVEQRIGRIDRIGQEYERVWIYNYFYQGTVEARVYQALQGRIGWFEDVVGKLQPILAEVGRVIQSIAMTPGQERQQRLNAEIRRLRQEMETRQVDMLDLDRYVETQEPLSDTSAPVTLADLQRVLTNSPSVKDRFQPHPGLDSAYLLRTGEGDMAVTFDPQLFDAHPNTLRLLSYGSQLLDDLLEAVEAPATETTGGILRSQADFPVPLRAYYGLENGRPRQLGNLACLRAALAETSDHETWSDETVAEAGADFAQERAQLEQRAEQVIAGRRRAERLALEERARQLLLRASLVELAMGQLPDMFENQALPLAFNTVAITGLRRHGYPFAPLLRLVNVEDLSPSPTDPFFGKVQGKPRETLRRQFTAIENQARALLEHIAEPPQP